MNDTAQTLLRSLVKFGAGWLVTKGYADGSTAEMIGAGFMGLVGVIWGVMHRKKPAPQPQASGSPPLTIPLVLLLCSGLVAGTAGCSSTPETILYRAESTSQVTVEKAMLAWNDYVKEFHPTADQERAVKDLYESYQAAATAAADAGKVYAAAVSSGSTNAPAVRATAELQSQAAAGRLSDLVNLLRKFGVKI